MHHFKYKPAMLDGIKCYGCYTAGALIGYVKPKFDKSDVWGACGLEEGDEFLYSFHTRTEASIGLVDKLEATMH